MFQGRRHIHSVITTVGVGCLLGNGVASEAWAQAVVHDWLGSDGQELVNSGTTGAVNDAVLIDEGAGNIPIVENGTATVFNGFTPGPGAGFGDDDGFVDLGVVAGFQGATFFELEWQGLDLDETAGNSSWLGGALAPGFSTGSLMTLGLSDVFSGTGTLNVNLYEAGGQFGGGDEDEVVESIPLGSVIPVTPHDLRIVFTGNGLTQAQGGFGDIAVFVDGEEVAREVVLIGVLNPDEDPASFGLGKYHAGSTVAGAYTTGQFSIGFGTTLPGDADGDGDVDAFDLGIWQTQFGEVGEGLSADFDRDDDVDGFDLGLWQSNFGTGTGNSAVPEPVSIAPMLIGLAALWRNVRRRE